MIDVHAAFAHHLLDIAIADPVPAVPTHRPQDHLTLKMTPLEIRHALPPNPLFEFHTNAAAFCNRALITTKEERHIRESVQQLKIPCFRTSIHERTAFSHMFRFKVAIDELSSRETNGLEAALENANSYAAEVIETLRAARKEGSAS